MINMKFKTEKYRALKTTCKGNFRPDGNYLLIVNYDLLYYSSNNYIVITVIMLLTLNNSAVLRI